LGYNVNVDEDILGCAVRYALPRMTYMVGVVTDEVIKNVDSLSMRCRSVIMEDIQRAFKEDRVSKHDCDVFAWRETIRVLQESFSSKSK